MPNGSHKQTIAILMLVIAVIGLTATAVTKYSAFENRLSDIEDILNMGSYEDLPVGSIVAYRGTGELPLDSGWLLCDGRNVPDGEKYEDLRRICKTTPDLRGMFLRGAGQNAKKKYQYEQREPRLVGSPQEYATALPQKNFWADLEHKHDYGRAVAGNIKAGGTEPPLNNPGGASTQNALSKTQNTTEGGGDEETRPNNYAVNFIIKAF